MTTARKWMLTYAGAVILLFAGAYFLSGIRGAGLHIALTLINLPMSVVVVPAGERFAHALGWPLGGLQHVVLTQASALAANLVLLYAAVRLFSRKRP